MRWEPQRYLRFERERTQPARDLAARLALTSPRTLIDLGCGPGNSTAVLAERFAGAELVGVDVAQEMLQRARAAHPELRFEQGDARSLEPKAPPDLIFSNACLQWLPDHAALFGRLFGLLSPGGVLAVQLPFHLQSPLHRAMDALAREGPWAPRMGAALEALTVHGPEFYYEALAPAAAGVELWVTSYLHVLEGHRAIFDWIASSGLRPFHAALGQGSDRHDFDRALLAAIERDYPLRSDGRVLFAFPRLFIVAHAP
ncbi:MAG: methyltransferase domain-containing protein [Myxococcales bacterium]|nr:methyltransferase domain-containing protein [Myxococcales bacterium]